MKKLLLIISLLPALALAQSIDCDIQGAITDDQMDYCDYDLIVESNIFEFVQAAFDPDIGPFELLMLSGRLSHEIVVIVEGVCNYYSDITDPICENVDKAKKYNNIFYFIDPSEV